MTLQEIIDAHNEGLISDADFGPIAGQIHARRKQVVQEEIAKAEAEGLNVLQYLKDRSK